MFTASSGRVPVLGLYQMNSCMFFRLLLLVLVIVQVAGARSAQAVVAAPSNGGNSLEHAIGWQTFTPDPSRAFGISDKTPDSNSTFDATPVGSHAVVPEEEFT